MKSAELRQKYLDFFVKNGHKIIPSASLIPGSDSSTLFIGSGMQPMVPYLLGEKHPLGTRICDSQKSFRVGDIEEVGDGRHNTFFEMLGNWSLGDYFKKEQLPWIYSFLVDEIKLDAQNLYATVFRGAEKIGVPRDFESVEILKQVFKTYNIDAKDIDFSEKDGMQGGRIFYYPVEKNWWSKSGTPEKMPLGEIGGPDSEIFYDLGAGLKKHENSQWSGQECHVNCDCGRFIEIGNNVFIEYKKTNKGFEKLDQQNVDFGGGLERMTMASQGLDNIFETDLFLNIIKKIEELSGKKYRDDKKSFEVIADHIKASVFLINDGVTPSNTGRGYVLRRLLRRAIRHLDLLGIEKGEIASLIQSVTDLYLNIYISNPDQAEYPYQVILEEEDKFRQAITGGTRVLNTIVWNTIEELGRKIANVHQESGIDFELAVEILKQKDVEITNEEKAKLRHIFDLRSEEHQKLSRTASAGMFKGGLADHDLKTIKLHTAHHLLLAALQELFGKEVKQRGSNITQERLRIDFSFDRKITDEEKKKLEDMVNEKIRQGLDVVKREMPLGEAEKIGAEMEFGVKYGNTVSVYFIVPMPEASRILDGEAIGKDIMDKVFSKEFCGGPHIQNTSELGKFKIIKEEASSQGVRRIRAVLE